MNSDETSIERVRLLVDRADRLRMQSAAVPLKELKALLQICERLSEQRHAEARTEPEVN